VRNHNAVVQVREIKNNAVYKSIFIIRNRKSSKSPEINKFHEMIKLYSLAQFKKEFQRLLRKQFPQHIIGKIDHSGPKDKINELINEF